MKRDNKEKLNHDRSGQSREDTLAMQSSAIVRQIKSKVALNLSRDSAPAQAAQKPNIYLVPSNASRDRFGASNSSSVNRFDYRKQRSGSGLKPYQIKKALKDDSIQYMQQSFNVEQTAPPLN
jgi:hypothetical protein